MMPQLCITYSNEFDIEGNNRREKKNTFLKLENKLIKLQNYFSYSSKFWYFSAFYCGIS